MTQLTHIHLGTLSSTHEVSACVYSCALHADGGKWLIQYPSCCTLQAEFAPDGGYIPRIIFAEANGTVRPDIKNPGAQGQYEYFYHSVDAVKAGMENALKMLAKQGAPAVEPEKASDNAPKEAEKATDKTSEL